LEYLLRPPTELQVMWEELLYTSTMKIREILEMQVVDENGKANPKIMDLQLKTFMYLSDRRRGHVLGQARIEGIAAKSQMQVNVAIAQTQAGVQAQATAESSQSLEDIEREIQALEQKQLVEPEFRDITAQVIDEKEKQEI
jgi:hypothetical protein